MTLYNLIAMAYGQNSCMRWAKYGMLTGGPDWVRNQKFTIQAVMPEGVPNYTFRQFVDGQAPRLQAMLQSLLETRFRLSFHHEKKELPVFELGPGERGRQAELGWSIRFGRHSFDGKRRLR